VSEGFLRGLTHTQCFSRADAIAGGVLASGKSTWRAFAGATATSGIAPLPRSIEEEVLGNRDSANGE